jgi:outer membrane lipoprotein SlyB
MTAAVSSQAPGSTQAAPSGLAAVPRALWVVVGTLAVATAGLAGALVMRSIDSQPAPPAVASQVAPTQVAAAHTEAQPPVQQVAPAQLQAAPQQEAPAAKPAPVKQVAKPAPARPPVQQATGSATHAPAPVQQVAQAPSRIETTRTAICNTCGTVQSVQEVKEKGQGSGIGAIGGAVVGGLLGNQVGGGNGKKVMTVVGAVGGGLAGHEAEKHVRATSAYDVQVRMEDGSVRTFRRTEPLNPGTRVFVEGNSLRVGGQGGQGAVIQQPRTIRTSVPAEAGA